MIEKNLNNYYFFSYFLLGDDEMKLIFRFIKKIIFSTFLLYGYNLIAVKFNMIIPINIFTLSFVTVLGTPSILALLLFYYLIL